MFLLFIDDNYLRHSQHGNHSIFPKVYPRAMLSPPPLSSMGVYPEYQPQLSHSESRSQLSCLSSFP